METNNYNNYIDALAVADNLEFMQGMPENSVDLVYADVLFSSGTDFGAYDDRFKDMASYLAFMRPRLTEMRRVLKDSGTLWLHCDVRTSAHQRIMLDDAFGASKFLNEIVWRRTRIKGMTMHAKGFGKITDRILLYGDRLKYKDAVRIPLTAADEAKYPLEDERGRYQSVSLTADGLKKLGSGSPRFKFMGHDRHWQYSEANMRQMLADDRIIRPKKAGGLPRRKCYMHEARNYPADLWDDINFIEAGSSEKTGYPTQKPEKLLERIILSSTKEGDVVFEPFLGSGTAVAVAKRLNRKYCGCDVNQEAVKIAEGRVAEPGMLVADD